MTTATAAPPSSALANLLLVRMALPDPSPKKLHDDLAKVLGAGPSAAELAEVQNELLAAGLLEQASRGKLVPSEAGRDHALRFLGIPGWPAKLNWQTVIAKHLFPKAAGLSPAAAAKCDNGDKLAALVLKRKYGLAPGAGTTVNQVLQALVCKQLGLPEEITLDGLLRTVLSRLVGADGRLTRDDLAQQLPLFGTGLRRVNAQEARAKVVRDWLADYPAAPSSAPAQSSEPFDLSAFARTVQALAQRAPAGDRFHANKVFIAPLWRASQREPGFPRLTLHEFKQRLIEANAQHQLHLSRADFVQAMDRKLLDESETAHLNATFHFVLLEEPRS